MAGNEQDIRATLMNSQEEQEKNSALDALIDFYRLKCTYRITNFADLELS